MTRTLNVSPTMKLPADAVTSTFAVLAMVGAGKSNAGAVFGEEFYAAGLPFVAIDPKGDWWGLRSSGDGTGPGLPIPIFGGLHGDLPLHEDMGKLIADLIVDQNLTCILDVSEFPSKAAQMRFLTDFGEHLYRRHGRQPQPRHLIMEEADEYLPQIVRADETRCVGVWTRIAKRGRQRGLGFTIISQRSAAVNKDALSQCATLIPLRTTGSHDRKAILDWISYHDASRDVVDSLPGLADGEAYAISPHWLVRHGQPAVQRFRFRQRWTFDSGATPQVGRARPVATLADIDLGALEVRMAAVVEKAAADDPRRLKKRIAELERQLARRADTDPAEVARLIEDNEALRAELAAVRARPPEQIEVPAFKPGDLEELDRLATALNVALQTVALVSEAVRDARIPAALDDQPFTAPQHDFHEAGYRAPVQAIAPPSAKPPRAPQTAAEPDLRQAARQSPADSPGRARAVPRRPHTDPARAAVALLSEVWPLRKHHRLAPVSWPGNARRTDPGHT